MSEARVVAVSSGRRLPAVGRFLSSSPRVWKVYLSGEIHSDWRQEISRGLRGLPVELTHPNLNHEDSDDCGALILGDEATRMNYDNKGARLNLIRTKTAIADSDVVVVRFGEKYRQWNAAFDAGTATALGKCLITLHPPNLGHALKEVNAQALAVCQEPSQVKVYFLLLLIAFLRLSTSSTTPSPARSRRSNPTSCPWSNAPDREHPIPN